MNFFGKFCFGVVLSSSAILSRAYAAVFLWRWFMVPTFHLPELTWATAIGISLVFEVMNPSPTIERKDNSYLAISVSLFMSAITPWFLVWIGYIVKR